MHPSDPIQTQFRPNSNPIQAVGELWKSISLNDITLKAVAEKSGYTVRTILRKFGSREGLSDASMKYDAANIQKKQGKAPVEIWISSSKPSFAFPWAGIRTIMLRKHPSSSWKIWSLPAGRSVQNRPLTNAPIP